MRTGYGLLSGLEVLVNDCECSRYVTINRTSRKVVEGRESVGHVYGCLCLMMLRLALCVFELC